MCLRNLVLLRESGEVRILEVAEIRSEIAACLREEMPRGEHKEERRKERPRGEHAIAREDGARQARDACVQQAGRERLVGRNDRLNALCERGSVSLV